MAVALIQRGRQILGIGDCEESALDFARDWLDWELRDTITVRDIRDEDCGYDGDLYFEDLYDPVAKYAERHTLAETYQFMMGFDEDKFYEERRRVNAGKRVSDEEFIIDGAGAERALVALCEQHGIDPAPFRGVRFLDVPEDFIGEVWDGTIYRGVHMHVPREILNAARSGMNTGELLAMWAEFAPIADVEYPPAECWTEYSVRRAPETGGA